MTSKTSSINAVLSDRYALALYDLLVENKSIERSIKQINTIKEYQSINKDFKFLLVNPLIQNSDKLKILINLLKHNEVDKIILNFIKVISKNNRFIYLMNIIDRFNEINSEKRGSVIVNITSAEELKDSQKNKINDELLSSLGSKLSINYKVDKFIIGGLIIKIGSKMIDSSILNKINKLKLAIKG